MNAVKSGTTTTTTTTSKPPPIVILGDVKMKEIPEMLLNKAMMNHPGFGGLAYFLESFKGAFGVAPTASVVTMTLACTLVDNNFIELLVLLYGVSVVSDVLLKDRDVILAENVIKGVDIAKRLRKKELLSKQFTFSSSSCSLTNNDDDDVCDEEKEDAALPVFTLKRPFENKDEIRRLNLFEPRWLAMLDEIANRNDGSLVGAKLGVVLAQNRLYTPANFDKIEQQQKRVATIVFDPFVQRAKVVDAKESTRPVTGARKVEVFIALDSETNDDFIGDFREAPGQRGYMLASKKLEKKTTTTTTTTTTSKESTIGQRRRRRENDVLLRDDVNDDDDDAKKKKTTTTKPPTPIACVVVCGKLHVRGVVGRLSRESSFFFDDDSRRQSRFQSRSQSDEKSGYRSSRSSIKVM